MPTLFPEPLYAPEPSPDAVLLRQLVDQDWDNDTLRLALIDAYEECGCAVDAMLQRYVLEQHRFWRRGLQGLGLPPDLVGETRT